MALIRSLRAGRAAVVIELDPSLEEASSDVDGCSAFEPESLAAQLVDNIDFDCGVCDQVGDRGR